MPTAPTPFRIDLDLLGRLDACAPQRAAFAAAFPDGIEIPEGSEPDPEIVERVVAANLNVAWMCSFLLADHAYHLMLTDFAREGRVRNAAVAPAGRGIDEAIRLACGESTEALEQARLTYTRALAEANRAFDKAAAQAAWRLLSDPKNVLSPS